LIAEGILNRILIAFGLSFLVIGLNYLGTLALGLLVLVISFLGLAEFKKLSKNFGVQISLWTYFFIGLFILLPVYIATQNYSPLNIFVSQGILLLISYLVVLMRVLLKKQERSFEDVSASMFAILHLGFLPSFYIYIREMTNGFEHILILFFCISVNDIFSMLIGKSFGKQPLSPISPKKTVEGSIAGLLAGSLFFFLALRFLGFGLDENFMEFLLDYLPIDNISFLLESFFLIFFGLILSALAQIGDLIESLFKRASGVKDSGKILFSHGGILDRIDSHYFAAWYAYFIFAYLIGVAVRHMPLR
jgi:phosphatidate cytidylyltransferase